MYTSSQRLFLSILGGVLFGLAWNNTFPAIIFIALVPLLLIENDISGSNKSVQVFWLSWLCFLIWNIMAAWWIGYASLAGAVALLTFNSFWMAVVFWLYHISKNNFKAKHFLLIIYWISHEYLYQRTEISWPWFNLGNIFGNSIEWVQWYEYTGILGGTLWVLVVNVLVAEITIEYVKLRKINQFKIVTAIATILVPSLLSLFMYKTYKEITNPTNVVVIQPNIDPYTEKFNKISADNQLKIILNEAQKASSPGPDYFIAPETAILGANLLNKISDSPSVEAIQNFLKKYPNTGFIIGAETQRYYPGQETKTAQRMDTGSFWEDRYNSALLIDTTKEVQIYHKSKLVVGVEKMPFSQYLKFLDKFHIKLGGTYGNLASQKEREVFKLLGTNSYAAPVICFESVYGDYVTDYVKAGATLLFVITNDGWWKNSHGTWQHLNLSRLRAIETRRSVARSANTGISAIIDQRGVIVQYLDWNKKGSIKGSLNENIKLTFYSRVGDLIGIISLIITLIAMGFAAIKKTMKTLLRKNPKYQTFFKQVSL